ncbi:sulfite oxidase, partial [bacterium]
MRKKMRMMSKEPLNAETPIEFLRSWVTENSVFFNRNQSAIPSKKISPKDWELKIEGEVQKPLTLSLQNISHMPKSIVANTLECSGNSRSLLKVKVSGNPWTIGGVGNAVWGGIWLKDLLMRAGVTKKAHHVA